MALKWVLEHQFLFLKALLFVMMDLTGEVAYSFISVPSFNCFNKWFSGVSGSPDEIDTHWTFLLQIFLKSM